MLRAIGVIRFIRVIRVIRMIRVHRVIKVTKTITRLGSEGELSLALALFLSRSLGGCVFKFVFCGTRELTLPALATVREAQLITRLVPARVRRVSTGCMHKKILSRARSR